MQNVTWIKPTQMLLLRKKAALVSLRCPAVTMPRHDPKSTFSLPCQALCPRTLTHHWAGSSCGFKSTWDSKFLEQMLHMEKQLFQRWKAFQQSLLFAAMNWRRHWTSLPWQLFKRSLACLKEYYLSELILAPTEQSLLCDAGTTAKSLGCGASGVFSYAQTDGVLLFLISSLAKSRH